MTGKTKYYLVTVTELTAARPARKPPPSATPDSKAWFPTEAQKRQRRTAARRAARKEA